MDLFENGSGGDGFFFFSGDICRKEGDQDVAGKKGVNRRNSDASDGDAAYGGGVLPLAFIQQEKTAGNLLI